MSLSDHQTSPKRKREPEEEPTSPRSPKSSSKSTAENSDLPWGYKPGRGCAGVLDFLCSLGVPGELKHLSKEQLAQKIMDNAERASEFEPEKCEEIIRDIQHLTLHYLMEQDIVPRTYHPDPFVYSDWEKMQRNPLPEALIKVFQYVRHVPRERGVIGMAIARAMRFVGVVLDEDDRDYGRFLEKMEAATAFVHPDARIYFELAACCSYGDVERAYSVYKDPLAAMKTFLQFWTQYAVQRNEEEMEKTKQQE